MPVEDRESAPEPPEDTAGAGRSVERGTEEPRSTRLSDVRRSRSDRLTVDVLAEDRG